MGLTSDIGLIEGFSAVISLDKIAKGRAYQTSAIRAATSQASEDADRLRVSLDDNSKRLEAAQREGNQVMMEQLQVQQQQLQFQHQQTESQLRVEQAEADQRALEANDDEIVSAMWACVEGAKNNLKDQKLYSSLIFGINARLAYGQLVPQARKSDTKIKLSQLNDQARDLMDQLLTNDTFPLLLTDGVGVIGSMKQFVSSTSYSEAESFIENQDKALSTMNTLSINIPALVGDIDKLQTVSRNLETEGEKLSKAIDELSQNDFVLLPLSESSIRDFLSTHLEYVNKLKQQIESRSGISIDTTLESVDQLNALREKISTLRNQVNNKIAEAQAKVAEVKNISLRAGMKKKTRIFWSVCMIGLGLAIAIGILSGPDGSSQRGAPIQAWFFGMVVYWFILRFQKKKLRSKLEIT